MSKYYEDGIFLCKTPAEVRKCRKIAHLNWATGFLGQYHELNTLYGTTNAPLTSPVIEINYDLIDETETSRIKSNHNIQPKPLTSQTGNNSFGHAYAQKLQDITEYIVKKAEHHSRKINMPNVVEDPHSNIRKPTSTTPVPTLTNRSLQNIKLVQSASYTTRELREIKPFEDRPSLRSNSPKEETSSSVRPRNSHRNEDNNSLAPPRSSRHNHDTPAHPRSSRPLEDTASLARPRSNSPLEESPSPDFRKSNQNYGFSREETSDVDDQNEEKSQPPVYLNESQNTLQNSQIRASGLYVITDKPVAQRYWQVKFQEKPEIPIKQVDMTRKAQKQRQAEYEELHYSVEQGPLSPMYKMSQRLDHLNKNDSEVSHQEGAYQKAKYIPYFQYSASNLKTGSSLGVKSALTERSQSPLGSPEKQSNFKKYLENEVLHISKGIPSSGMTDGFMSASKNPNYVSSTEQQLGLKAAPSSSSVNSSIVQSSRLMSSKLTRGMSPTKNKKNNQNNLDYVIVDANRRYMLPRSPKYNNAKKVEFLKESANKQTSLRYLSSMES